jgi:hypothetical protein
MSVLEKLKALDSQRAQLLEDAKKEAFDNAEKAVAELSRCAATYRADDPDQQTRANEPANQVADPSA